MDELEQATRLRKAVEGDGDAIQQLVACCHGALYAFVIRRMTPETWRAFEPEDVLQETYAAAFKTIRGCRFEGQAAFYAWLEAIAASQLARLCRDRATAKRGGGRARITQLMQPAGGTTYPSLLERFSSPGASPSRCLAEREASAAIVSSMARLTEEQRAVVRMRFMEGRSVDEVAARLGKSNAAVHMLCHRALKNLRVFVGSISRFLTDV